MCSCDVLAMHIQSSMVGVVVLVLTLRQQMLHVWRILGNHLQSALASLDHIVDDLGLLLTNLALRVLGLE